MSEWNDLHWFVVFNGIADACLWGFDADGWRLRHDHPARGTLGILPNSPGAPVVTMDEATWLADALAFDHDAPVGVRPAVTGVWPHAEPKDPAATPPSQPVEPLDGPLVTWYWDALQTTYGAAAELRFNASYVIRYESDFPDPGTNFSERFSGREVLVSLYAMAARQADILAEYLCLYRILEAVDGGNGTDFASAELSNLLESDFGLLRVVHDIRLNGGSLWTSVFDLYKHRSRVELSRLATEGIDDVPQHLYRIRNSLAHGKTDVLVGGHGSGFETAARALPIVKLLARVAVEAG